MLKYKKIFFSFVLLKVVNVLLNLHFRTLKYLEISIKKFKLQFYYFRSNILVIAEILKGSKAS
jgi:hypothetical protein